MADDSAKKLIGAYDALKSAKATTESHLQEIRDVLLPIAKSFTGIDVAGAKNRHQIFDNSGESASELLSAGLNGFLTNQGTKWFGLRAKDLDIRDNERVVIYLEGARQKMFRVFESPDSGFATSIGEVYQELGDFGTSGLYVADRLGGIPLYASRPLAELFIAESNEGKVDTVHRKFDMSARQAVQEFGKATGEKVGKAASEPAKANSKFDFLHCIFPRTDRVVGSMNANQLPVASHWISLADKSTIKVGGFHEMPFVTPRWAKRSGEVYGRGPGHKALADVKMLQRSMKSTIRGAEETIRPALQVADDGVLGPVRLGESAINVVRADIMRRGGSAIVPIVTGGRIDLGEEFMAGIRLRIERAYYNHLLQLSRDPRMTATQALLLDEETLRVLGPFLGRIQTELLGPLISRTFAILARAGVFGAPPPELEDREIEVVYESPAVLAQRLSEVRALGQLEEITAGIVARNPAVADNIDDDAAYRHAADRLGVPKDVMRPVELVADMRRQRQEEAARQAAKQDITELAPAAQAAAQALGGGGVGGRPQAANAA